ncbi:hypothetical protein LIER_41574 [Lithospermum erythrorhizon]|uniref:Helitron helicase-like domain-containing protein n=1 Tax=Lithospermum erythrorhizon TaxID=34254 RepID=A0AAV3RES1_LITER
MELVQEFGRPNLFLIITCNLNWPEIKEHLQPGEEAQNRLDLCARVFKAKLSILNDIIMSGEVFGNVSSVIHVVEFQKRGLPHAYFLIILKPEYKYMTQRPTIGWFVMSFLIKTRSVPVQPGSKTHDAWALWRDELQQLLYERWKM